MYNTVPRPVYSRIGFAFIGRDEDEDEDEDEVGFKRCSNKQAG
jgi:hypothetical protein